MGHYYFINQIAKEGDDNTRNSRVTESKYEIPPMYFPLFSGEVHFDECFLYANAEQGYRLFKKMYDFIDIHKEKIFDKPEEFSKIKDKILELVEPTGSYYQLDGTDVFLMDLEDEPDAMLQAVKECYQIIKEVNTEIQNCIEKEDIEGFLSIYTDARITHRSESLRYFFKHKNYNYGYEPLCFFGDPLDKKENELKEVEVFRENGKAVLKTKSNVRLSLVYDEIWDFADDSELAVVMKDNFFGYLNKKGEEVIPLMYEDAYDHEFEGEKWDPDTNQNNQKYRAPVKLNQKFGLIDEKNQCIVPMVWDDLLIRYAPDYFNYQKLLFFAKHESKYCILDCEGKEIYPPVIESFLKGESEPEEEEQEEVPGFYNRLWIKEEKQAYYLNHLLQPFAYDLVILEAGNPVFKVTQRSRTRNQLVGYYYLAKDKAGKQGVVFSDNTIAIPFIYDSITYQYECVTGGGKSFYFAKNEQGTTVFYIGHKNQFRQILTNSLARIEVFECTVLDDIALVLTFGNKKILYSVKTQASLLTEEYSAFYVVLLHIGITVKFVLAFKKDSLEMYHHYNLEPKEMDVNTIDILLKDPRLKKHKATILAVKALYSNKQIKLIFPDENRQKMAVTYFPKLNFDALNEVIDATAFNEEHLENAVILEKTMVLFEAFEYHYHNSKKDAVIQIQYGNFHYNLAQVYFSGNQFLESYQWCIKAISLLPKNNNTVISAMDTACRAAYLEDNYHDSNMLAKQGLEWIEGERSRVNKGLTWWVNNVKKHLEYLKDVEENLLFYSAKSYYFIADQTREPEDYQSALQHIEIAIEMSDWEMYYKKFIWTVCTYNLSDNVAESTTIFEKFIAFAKDYEPDNDLFYVKYLYAFHEFHENKNKKKALQLIEEVLALDAEYKVCSELKEEINKSKGFLGLF
jgi:tetratricopeptide (TPR) repeat protein